MNPTRLRRAVLCGLLGTGVWACGRPMPRVQPIVVTGDLSARGVTAVDVATQAQQAISDRLAQRERMFQELHEPGSLWQSLRVEQADIDAGLVPLPTLIDIGRDLFRLDVGRAQGGGNGLSVAGATTGTQGLRHVQRGDFGGPDGTRCAGCHHIGGVGGSGFRVDNSFLDGDGERPQTGLERNPRALFGAAVIDRLAVEMSQDLQEQVLRANRELKEGEDRVLSTKGVPFGSLRRVKGGRLDLSGVRGVSLDFIVRPFGWKGTTASLRQMIVSSLQQNLGIQADEILQRLSDSKALGDGPKDDPDRDGVQHEATEGMVTALVSYLASLSLPTQEPLLDSVFALRGAEGEAIFAEIGCADCHRPTLTLRDPVMSLGPTARSQPRVDLSPLFGAAHVPTRDKGIEVALYSDLRRHNLGEVLAEPRGYLGIPKTHFMTPPLWGLAASGPYLHDGRAGDIEQAILAHGGEAAAARAAYEKLSLEQGGKLRLFLISLGRPTHLEFKP